MTRNNSEPPKLSAPELHWIRQLREHPELMERFAMIMEITSATNGSLKSADAVEGLLIRELRRLGNTAMGSWAAQAEHLLAGRLKEQDASARVLKQKALKWWCLFGAVSVRERIWSAADNLWVNGRSAA